MTPIRTIDAEVAGEAVRLIVSGAPSVPGRTMVDKLSWLRKHGENVRRLLMLEPRGHAGMHGAMLTEPVSALSHAGLLAMNAAGFPPVSGEAIIAAVTIALERKLIDGVQGDVLVDTPAGTFRAAPRSGAGTVEAVVVSGVSSSVHSAALPLRIGTRKVSVDVAFAGEFYAIADSEAIGIPVDMANAAALIRMGRDMRDAIGSPDIQGAIFTGAPRAGADLRSATVLDGEVLRRSPGLTGTAALMAVLDAMGVLPDDHTFVHEGILGTTLQGRVVSRNTTDTPSVIAAIEGSASITGFHEFVKS